MTSALYLEHYLDGLESLPTELKRNFTLMRELDTRAQNLMKQIDEEASDLMKNNISAKENFSEEEKKSKLKHIQELFGRAKEYGDDKVQLAIQTYELVDKHIRRLDSDLARFEGEIQDKTNTTRDKSEDGNVGKKGRKKTKDAKVAGKKKRSLSDEEEKVEEKTTSTTTHKSNKKQKVTQEKEGRKAQKQKNVEVEEAPAEGHFTPHPSDVLDMPVDPNEPTYCLCHQVSYGEMIGCDNSDCPIEWFHFACVGLTTKPKGKWYCPKCQINRKKK